MRLLPYATSRKVFWKASTLMPLIAINVDKSEDCAPRRSGLRPDGIDYDNTLVVIAAPGRRHDEEVRAGWSEPGTLGKKWG